MSYGPLGWSGRGPDLAAETKGKVCNSDCRPQDRAQGSCRDVRSHRQEGRVQIPKSDEIYL